MHVVPIEKPSLQIAEETPSWQSWKLTCFNGRQRWEFNPPSSIAGLDHSSQAYGSFLASMSKDFIIDKSKNPNTTDKVYLSSRPEPDLSPQLRPTCENPLMYPSSLSMGAAKSAYKGISHLNKLQQDDGHWPGDYGGPLFLLPALLFAAHITSAPLAEEKKVLMTRYMLNHQNTDGGWGLHIEGDSTMFGTVMQYCALRILGLKQAHSEIKKAQLWISAHGGAESIPSWGKFFLALLGVYEWEGCNSLFPESWVLPKWMPIHPGRYWCHARMVYLPMAYCYANRISSTPDSLISELRKELYTADYTQIAWPKYRNHVADTDLFQPMSKWAKVLYKVLGWYEKFPFKPGRKKAVKFMLSYIEAEDEQTDYIDIGPVNQIINSICIWHAYGADSEKFKKHVARWDDYLWLAEDGMKMNGYNGSQLWDTAFTVQAMLENQESGASPEVLSRAYDFIENAQIKEEVKDKERFFRHPSVGGWPFSTQTHGWPISDCTAEGLKSILKLHRSCIGGSNEQYLVTESRLHQAVDLILSFQNADGGWGTYENYRADKWLENLNPSDIFGQIMIDYSWVECSSTCLSSLLEFAEDYPEYRSTDINQAVQRGVNFVLQQQREDGSWMGAWGVCFTYGTWFGIEALVNGRAHVGDNKQIEKACNFLVSKQRSDGGWGESYLSCVESRYVEHTDSQVVQTAWALLALMAAHYPEKSVIEKGIALLRSRQLDNGSWPQEGISGVFNKTCMITYSAYRNVFPIWALERYAGSYSRILRNGSK